MKNLLIICLLLFVPILSYGQFPYHYVGSSGDAVKEDLAKKGLKLETVNRTASEYFELYTYSMKSLTTNELSIVLHKGNSICVSATLEITDEEVVDFIKTFNASWKKDGNLKWVNTANKLISFIDLEKKPYTLTVALKIEK
ncbi:hypothetical protein [Rufibacter sp. LB8]|uniref:hypothetical protein n=1 Tax=Rufibacter sp. LB8 TaxID=2777781 RepID=UPI00178C55FF|nr:hypothetical protein [Rufibacter sp. LB8]